MDAVSFGLDRSDCCDLTSHLDYCSDPREKEGAFNRKTSSQETNPTAYIWKRVREASSDNNDVGLGNPNADGKTHIL